VEKLVWVPVLSFCKISFPVTHLMAYYAETGGKKEKISKIISNYYSGGAPKKLED
jgi:hypothetical protein